MEKFQKCACYFNNLVIRIAKRLELHVVEGTKQKLLHSKNANMLFKELRTIMHITLLL